jgi:hypothetical protein
MEDLTGRQFGPYQIVAPLGEGGMAAVNGDHTFPATFAADYGLGEWVRLTVEAKGAHIAVLLNGEQIIDFEDVDHPILSGRLGLRCYGEPTAPCEANFSEFYLSH